MSNAMPSGTGQTTVGDEAQQQEHMHPAQVHSHDHYHVTHHHTGGPLGEFDHRAHYHSHEHDNEDEDHGKEAHVHDHNEPAGEGL